MKARGILAITMLATILIALSLGGCSKHDFVGGEGEIPKLPSTVIPPIISSGEVEFVENEILIKVTSDSDLEEIVESIGGEIIEEIPQLGVVRVRLSASLSAFQALNKLEDMPGIEYAEYNYLRYLHVVPNDPLYTPGQWGPKIIDSEKAWDITTGSEDVIIAVIDTGVDGTHPDLYGKVLDGYDTVNEIPIPANTNSDWYGHGTHVSGIAAGWGNDNIGIAGTAWRCLIMPVKVFPEGGGATDADIAEAIIYATDYGALVINMSLGGPGYSQTLKDAVDYALSNNVVVAASMGNESKRIYGYPAGYQGVIAVGATDANDELASFSTRGHYASVAAPGYRILSALPLIIGGINPDEATTGYASWSGTSMSCPFVAGAAALILSLHPELTPDQVKAQLEKTAVDLGPTGFDEGFGYGRIDLAAALADLVQNDYGAIEVTVTDAESGELLEGVSVIIWQGGKVIETTATNEDGEAIFNSVKVGSYEVTASLTYYVTQEVNVTVTPGVTTTVTMKLQPVLGGETEGM